ncbi:TPA: hypothetical protein ACG5JQ_000295 [Stenotrophomonas maltophilia]|uniref:hypothetical protein n=1 Tax=Stenotrophomonas maltophilia TaxID=40324 RepID=UPI001312CD02|nr:hypothetical protein [Stenotrophomonas maltophilia]
MRDMVLHLHFEPRMAPRAILYGALTAALSFIGTVSADECRLDTPLSGPQAAPTSAPGTQWTYSGGAGLPATPMLLKAVQNGQRELEIAEGTLRREWIDTYADVNPLRKGDKVLLRFPLKVGDQWQDRFEEPGEFNARSGRYRYDYEEQGQSRVTAIETVRTAVGEVSAYRIEREARWRKSNARAVAGADRPNAGDGVVEGLERSISWYAPDVGRVVLRRRVSGNPAFAAYFSAEDDTDNLSITELVGFQQPGGCRIEGVPVQARVAGQVFPLHYPLVDSDTWEFRLMRDPHVPADR